ncbi:MAG: hypothetical protein JWQ49_2322 [Edaphobacter sp.]|nr:hypothetical protein [Edaphobacter sp.]
MVSRWGIADWEEIAPSLTSPQSPSGGSLRIDLLREAIWLGGSDRYFLVPTGKNGLANRLKHVLQVASNLSLKAAYDAIFRDTRVDASRLPFACFRDFCSAWPWCEVREDRVLATEAMPPIELVSHDDLLVAILRRFDRPVERFEIRELAHEAGIGEPSLNQLLSYSNVIIRTGPSLYSIVSDVAPFKMHAVIETEPAKSGEVETEASQAWESSDSLVADRTTATDPTSLLDGLDPASPEFSLRLTERIGLKNLPIPWSAAEIGLSSADRSALRQWGQVGKWDLRRDSRLTVEFRGRTYRGRLAFGLTFLLFCGEIARAEAASGTIWPPIYEAFGTQQREFLFVQEASPKLWLRDASEECCRVFGLRHGFGELGQRTTAFRMTICIFGLLKKHCRRYRFFLLPVIRSWIGGNNVRPNRSTNDYGEFTQKRKICP